MNEQQNHIENKYKILFETSRDALITLDPPDWNFTSGNPAAFAMFGVKDEAELTSYAPWNYSPEFQPDGTTSQEKAKEMIEIAMLKGVHFFDWQHKRIGGGEFPATVLLTKVTLRGKDLLQATVRDVTKQKHIEETLRHKIEELEAFNRVTINRELKMIQLKEEIEKIKSEKEM